MVGTQRIRGGLICRRISANDGPAGSNPAPSHILNEFGTKKLVKKFLKIRNYASAIAGVEDGSQGVPFDTD